MQRNLRNKLFEIPASTLKPFPYARAHTIPKETRGPSFERGSTKLLSTQLNGPWLLFLWGIRGDTAWPLRERERGWMEQNWEKGREWDGWKQECDVPKSPSVSVSCSISHCGSSEPRIYFSPLHAVN